MELMVKFDIDFHHHRTLLKVLFAFSLLKTEPNSALSIYEFSQISFRGERHAGGKYLRKFRTK